VHCECISMGNRKKSALSGVSTFCIYHQNLTAGFVIWKLLNGSPHINFLNAVPQVNRITNHHVPACRQMTHSWRNTCRACAPFTLAYYDVKMTSITALSPSRATAVCMWHVELIIIVPHPPCTAFELLLLYE
jgi:hypothetical protein